MGKEGMKKKCFTTNFIQDTRAVSEEFTSLPALALVMIGFSIFFSLIANTYITYHTRMDTLHSYQVADSIATKLTNPDCFFMKPGGIVNLPLLRNNTDRFFQVQEYYRSSGFSFCIRIRWLGPDGGFEDFPQSGPPTNQDRIAMSTLVGVYLNEAQTAPGSLTVILWRNMQ